MAIICAISAPARNLKGQDAYHKSSSLRCKAVSGGGFRNTPCREGGIPLPPGRYVPLPSGVMGIPPLKYLKIAHERCLLLLLLYVEKWQLGEVIKGFLYGNYRSAFRRPFDLFNLP